MRLEQFPFPWYLADRPLLTGHGMEIKIIPDRLLNPLAETY